MAKGCFGRLMSRLGDSRLVRWSSRQMAVGHDSATGLLPSMLGAEAVESEPDADVNAGRLEHTC